jgi:hypothetical protein
MPAVLLYYISKRMLYDNSQLARVYLHAYWTAMITAKLLSATLISYSVSYDRRMDVCYGPGNPILSWVKEQARPNPTPTWKTTAT